MQEIRLGRLALSSPPADRLRDQLPVFILSWQRLAGSSSCTFFHRYKYLSGATKAFTRGMRKGKVTSVWKKERVPFRPAAKRGILDEKSVSKKRKISEKPQKSSKKISNARCPLGELSKSFLKLIKSTADKTIDLNEAAERLAVRKRRIYDITNVMEGVGLLRKEFKNKVKWMGDEPADIESLRVKVDALSGDIKALVAQQELLDEQIVQVNESLGDFAADDTFRLMSYITNSDVQKIFESSSSASDRIGKEAFAIRAPTGTILEVRKTKKPGQDDAYEMFVQSPTTGIHTHRLDTYTYRLNSSTLDHLDSQPISIAGIENTKDIFDPVMLGSGLGNDGSTIGELVFDITKDESISDYYLSQQFEDDLADIGTK